MLFRLSCGFSISSWTLINTPHLDSTFAMLPRVLPKKSPCTTDPAKLEAWLCLIMINAWKELLQGILHTSEDFPHRGSFLPEIFQVALLPYLLIALSRLLRDKMNTLIVAMFSCHSPWIIWLLSTEGFNISPWWPLESVVCKFSVLPISVVLLFLFTSTQTHLLDW